MALSGGAVVGIIAGVVVTALLIWFISTYNRLVRMSENVNKSWADIDVLLKQRYDMIPNLVNIVKGYADHEKELFMEFAKARQAAAGALSSGDVRGQHRHVGGPHRWADGGPLLVAEAPWSVAEWAVAPRFDNPRATVLVLLLSDTPLRVLGFQTP